MIMTLSLALATIATNTPILMWGLTLTAPLDAASIWYIARAFETKWENQRKTKRLPRINWKKRR